MNEKHICEWLRTVQARVPHTLALKYHLKARRKFPVLFASPIALRHLLQYLRDTPLHHVDVMPLKAVLHHLDTIPYVHPMLMRCLENRKNDCEANRLVLARYHPCLTPHLLQSFTKLSHPHDIMAYVSDRVTRRETYWPIIERHIPGCASLRRLELARWHELIAALRAKLAIEHPDE